MSPYIGILPVDVLQTLSHKLNQDQVSCSLSFLRLPHPRTGVPALFLPHRSPSSGGKVEQILEVQAVDPPNPRSWFLGKDEVVDDGKLLMMTPIDPAFLLIPIFQTVQLENGNLGPFRPADDIFEDAAARLARLKDTSHVGDGTSARSSEKDILQIATLDCVITAMRRICDVKEITEELVVYRYSPTKVLEYLRIKVARLARPEVFERSRTLIRGLAKDGLMEDGKEDLLEAGRIRAACDLLGHYLPTDTLRALVASYDFANLNAYFKNLEDEAAALAAASANTTGPKKKASENNDKKRKALGKNSHGVEKLKKVNTTGMAKLSSFFKTGA